MNWLYNISLYYHDGGFAISVGTMTKGLMDIELSVSKSRHDIGKIVVSWPNKTEVFIRTESGWSK